MNDNKDIDELNSNGAQENDNNVYVDIPGIKEMHDYEMQVKNGEIKSSSQKSFMPINTQNN